MFCIECGKEVEEKANFCPNCGTKIETEIKLSIPVSTSNQYNFLAFIGGVSLFISFFMPWVDLGIISLSGYKLLQSTDYKNFFSAFILLGWLVPITGGVVAFLALLRNPYTSVVSQ